MAELYQDTIIVQHPAPTTMTNFTSIAALIITWINGEEKQVNAAVEPWRTATTTKELQNKIIKKTVDESLPRKQFQK